MDRSELSNCVISFNPSHKEPEAQRGNLSPVQEEEEEEEEVGLAWRSGYCQAWASHTSALTSDLPLRSDFNATRKSLTVEFQFSPGGLAEATLFSRSVILFINLYITGQGSVHVIQPFYASQLEWFT